VGERTFSGIFDAQSIDLNRRADILDGTAESAGWVVLHSGQSITLEEGIHAIVISGVPWSRPDLELLDELAARDTEETRVFFFNPDRVFPDERILPGASRMIQTPAMAEYAGKRLVAFTQGGSKSGGVIERIRSLFPILRTN
jgi:hypothetical protein